MSFNTTKARSCGDDFGVVELEDKRRTYLLHAWSLRSDALLSEALRGGGF